MKVDLVESCAKLREEKQHLKENYDESVKGRWWEGGGELYRIKRNCLLIQILYTDGKWSKPKQWQALEDMGELIYIVNSG